MASEATAATGTTLIGSFEKLFSSSVRFSGAATLYSVQQMESAFGILEGGEGFFKQMDKFGNTVESLTKSLAEDISPDEKKIIRQLVDSLKKEDIQHEN